MNIRNTEHKNLEEDILEPALTAFRRETNLRAERAEIEVVTHDGPWIDAILRIDLGGKAADYWAVIKPNLTNARIAQLAHEFEGNLDQLLLVTRYVYPQIGKTMRELGLQFIDTTGNVHINNPPTLILIQAHRRQQDTFAGREEMLGRAGLKVVFGLLQNRELLNLPYREMTKAVGVALGTVTGVMRDLTAQGFIVEHDEKRRRLLRKKELLDEWTNAYGQKLYPKLLIGRYAAHRPNFWQDTDIAPFAAQWGAETAANRMTHYLKPAITTIYATKPTNEIVLNLKLRKDKQGDVELRERFWHFQNNDVPEDLAPPLLVYADLLATGDARNIETANMIYDDYLKPTIDEKQQG